MAESITPRAKKAKRCAPLTRVTAEERARQFKDDLYADGGVLFCRFCEHSIDFTRVDTVKDHLKSKKHSAKREARKTKSSASEGPSTSRQMTLGTVVKSRGLREEFVLDYVKMCTLADIPLEKTDKIRPFLEKHCKQAGALPKVPTLRNTYVPKLFESHFVTLKCLLRDEYVSITADETTDVRDHSILNVIASVRGRPFLIGVVKMDACNHGTFSQAIIKSVSDVGIGFDHVLSIVSDSAAYCKKAFKDVLSAVYPNSLHVRCIAHIVNLAAEIFHHHADFRHTSDLIAMVKSSLFKKPGRKSRLLKFLAEFIAGADVKLPPVPVSSRWNSWFEAAIYHATRIHLYEGFYKAEKAQGMAVERILEFVMHKTIYPEICLQLYFIKENCQRLMTVLTMLEAKGSPLACTVYNLLEDLRSYLRAGVSRTSFGEETDRLLDKLPNEKKKKQIDSFQDVFGFSLKKLETHLDSHPAYPHYKAVRIFDPRQLPTLNHNIGDYTAIKSLQDPSPELLDEWLIYVQYRDELPNPLHISEFWEGMGDRFPNLAAVASHAIWMPVASVDVERSFSQYKHLLNDRRESLTEENTKQLVMLYYNGDIEGHF